MKKLWAALGMIFVMIMGTFNVAAAPSRGISAKGAVVIDARTGEVLFDRNKDMPLPMASTTKIMSVLLVLERKDLDKKFTVDSQAIKVEGSSMGLREGDEVTLRDLCCGMLLPSGNDAANAAAVRVAGSTEKFVEMMNKKAEELGLKSTHFVTPSGLDDNTDYHYSTAYDMARLTAKALENEDFCKICREKNIKLNFGNPAFDRWLTNTNKLLKNLDGCIGVKTGFTDKAKRCLVSACERDGVRLICVTLNDPNDWRDHTDLYNVCFGYYAQQELYINEKKLYVNVVGGNKDRIKCSAKTASAKLVKGSARNVNVKIKMPYFVYAPVKKGDKIGRAEYYYNNAKIAEEDILADESLNYADIESVGFFKGIWKKLIGAVG